MINIKKKLYNADNQESKLSNMLYLVNLRRENSARKIKSDGDGIRFWKE